MLLQIFCFIIYFLIIIANTFYFICIINFIVYHDVLCLQVLELTKTFVISDVCVIMSFPNLFIATDIMLLFIPTNRRLREQWELVCDQLSDTQRRLESCRIQWTSYDDVYEQLHKWLLDTEVQLKEDTDMKATLPDKKAQQQNHRVSKT